MGSKESVRVQKGVEAFIESRVYITNISFVVSYVFVSLAVCVCGAT